MTRLFPTGIVAALCVAAGGCVAEDEDDYCRNHHLFHAAHRAQTGTFEFRVGADGFLESDLALPASTFNSGRLTVLSDALKNAGAVFSAGVGEQCTNADASVALRGDFIRASYTSQCDAAVPLKRVNVSVLDLVQEVDEIVVSISTPATSKHFAISRQCSVPIFRLSGQ